MHFPKGVADKGIRRGTPRTTGAPMPSEIHAVDGGAVAAPASNPAAAQLAHQEPPPVEHAPAGASTAGTEDGRGQRVDASV